MSRILALFDIAPARDENGRSIIPAEEMTIGGITYVYPVGTLVWHKIDTVIPQMSRAFQVLDYTSFVQDPGGYSGLLRPHHLIRIVLHVYFTAT